VAISLLDRDPRSVTFQDLEDFLNEGHSESGRLDYKQEIVDSVADTMVAFANTDGGIVIGGVAEAENVGWCVAEESVGDTCKLCLHVLLSCRPL
jgi:phenylpyruvate tautomerase PptA (4-oxalocrotonate tautomerase family)